MNTIGIVGLGLIGGSFAKAYSLEADWRVLAYDKNETVTRMAEIAGDIDGVLTDDNIGECDLIVVGLYPNDAIDWTREKASLINKDTVLIDLCGVKKIVYDSLAELADEYGFTYVGGHPMAGTQYSGYKHASHTLFMGAPMVIVPKVRDDIELYAKVKDLLAPAGFSRLTVSTAEEHDKMIAFTSQLAHVVSNAYVKSPAAMSHRGFSAGSYRDLTRVAWLNESMWTELFMANKEDLIEEIDYLVEHLKEYSDAMRDGDSDRLKQLLKDGRVRKEDIDG